MTPRSQMARMLPVVWLLAWALGSPAVRAREAARLEVSPSSAVVESMRPLEVKVTVHLEGELVPSLPEDLGARVVGGQAEVRTRWVHDAALDAWRYRFHVVPREIGLVEVEFYHRELEQVGARGRLSLEVLPREDLPAPLLYQVQELALVGPLDPEIPIYLLPLEAIRLQARLPDDASPSGLTFLQDTHRDLSLQTLGTGEVLVTAAAEPDLPGVRHMLVVRDLQGRRPDVELAILVLQPCPICGQAHPAGQHADVLGGADLDPGSAAAELQLLDVADAVVFRRLNLQEPAPTYLETRERVAVFEGWTTRALSRLDAVVEYDDGRQRVYPTLASAGQPADEQGRSPFLLRFRLYRGVTTITFRIRDREGGSRSVEFTLYRLP